MEINYNEKFDIFTIDNLFDKKINKSILDEIINNKNNFNESTITGTYSKTDKLKIRSNTVAYYDVLYNNKRNSSVLLNSLDSLFSNGDFKSMLESSKFPYYKFPETNYHETQVSRYGNKGQKYEWHSDRILGDTRMITLVYYAFKEPKKFKGGILELSKLPVYNKKPFGEVLKFIPKNNSAIIFPSYMAHRVDSTSSTKKFEDGRFSINCWIGIK